MSSRSLLLRLKLHGHCFTKGFCHRASPQFTNAEVRRHRNEMFENEKKRQLAHVTRIEKIQVDHQGAPEDCRLVMNKGLSTPFNCAMHMGELLQQRSVLALVNGQPWDMHRPLEEDCSLQFLHFKDEDPHLSNEAFWRSCSFLLGHALEVAFKEDLYVELCSFPRPNVRSGSFVHDADLKLPDWQPTESELRSLSRIIAQLGHDDLKFERITVDASTALEMFQHNRFKVEQIPAIASQSATGNDVTLYKMSDHIDISRGPMIGSTQLIHRFNITAIHDIESPGFGALKRIQGVAMPKQIRTHYWTYEYLQERAAKLNKIAVPRLYSSQNTQEKAYSQ